MKKTIGRKFHAVSKVRFTEPRRSGTTIRRLIFEVKKKGQMLSLNLSTHNFASTS